MKLSKLITFLIQVPLIAALPPFTWLGLGVRRPLLTLCAAATRMLMAQSMA